MFKNIILSLFVSSIILAGCATDQLETYEPLKVPEFAPIEEYKLDLSKIDEQNQITLEGVLGSQIFVHINDDGTMDIVMDESEANGVVLAAEDLSKVADLADIAEGYRSVAVSQAELIKVKDETIKALQQMVLLQQQGKEVYRENFILADKLYKNEHKIRMREKLSSDIRFIATSIGIVAIAMI